MAGLCPGAHRSHFECKGKGSHGPPRPCRSGGDGSGDFVGDGEGDNVGGDEDLKSQKAWRVCGASRLMCSANDVCKCSLQM